MEATPTTIVLMLGTDPASVAAVLDDTRRMFGGDRLVYLTDGADFGTFRRHGAIFEHLPSPTEQAGFGETNWRDYLESRWQLLLGKWSPRRILVFGRTMEAFIAAAPGHPAIDRAPKLSEAHARLLRTRVADGE